MKLTAYFYDDNSQRDRLGFVRDVIGQSLPEETMPTHPTVTATSAETAAGGSESVRDESSRNQITEDDVRGLDKVRYCVLPKVALTSWL